MNDRDAWLHEQFDGATARKNKEVLSFLQDGTPSPETERLLRSVREACDRFWARRMNRKIPENFSLPDRTH